MTSKMEILLVLLKGASVYTLSTALLFVWLYFKEIPLWFKFMIPLVVSLIIRTCTLLSVRIRCILALSLPELTSKQGRCILLSVVTGLLFSEDLWYRLPIIHTRPRLASHASQRLVSNTERAFRKLIITHIAI